jgi:hypothetical protein
VVNAKGLSNFVGLADDTERVHGDGEPVQAQGTSLGHSLHVVVINQHLSKSARERDREQERKAEHKIARQRPMPGRADLDEGKGC